MRQAAIELYADLVLNAEFPRIAANSFAASEALACSGPTAPGNFAAHVVRTFRQPESPASTVSRPAIGVIESIYEAFELRDMPAVFKLFAPDIEIVQSDQLPWGGTFVGHDGARRFLTALTSQINSSLRIDRFITSGDDVVAIGWSRGKVNATGADYRVPVVHVWRVRDGRATHVQFFVDNPLMLAALGERRKNG